MGKKKLTLKAETVEYAIRRGLKQVGLPQKDTIIHVLQKDTQGYFTGAKQAVVSIIYDAEESKQAIKEAAEVEFKKKFKFLFEDCTAKISLPSMFYDKRYYENDEVRKEFLLNFLKDKFIDKPDPEAIKQLSTNPQAQGNFITVQQFKTEPLNDRGDEIFLKLSPDNMNCKALFFHKEGAKEEEVLEYLKEKGISKGILINNIKEVIKTHYKGFFDIARGKFPSDDQPAPIEVFFQEDEHKEFSHMMEALTVDTRSVKDINIADRNQLLISIGDVITGSDGYTVLGSILRKKEVLMTNTINCGSNVSLSDNKKEVYAKKAGHIMWKPDELYIDIEPIYIVDGNVDFNEGNIVGFVGKVVIKGDVKPKFSVVAEGDIEVHGSVEDAIVESTTGNVFIGGSIIHQNEGYIQAKGTIHGMIATNAKLRGETIILEKEVMNSNLEAKNQIIIIGAPGVLVGGIASAKNSIRANTIGSESWVPTKIHVGDVSERKKRLRSLNQQIGKHLSELKEAKQIVKLLQERQQDQSLTEAQSEQLETAQENVVQLEEDIEYEREEEEAIKEEIESQKDAKLEILKTLYPHVDLYIFEGYYLPPEAEHRTGFCCKEGLVVRFSLL